MMCHNTLNHGTHWSFVSKNIHQKQTVSMKVSMRLRQKLTFIDTVCSYKKQKKTFATEHCSVILFNKVWKCFNSFNAYFSYSLWAPTIMHWYWNRYNPTVLGSIYMDSPGRLQGRQWLINGEGLNGCLVMIPVAFAVVLDLKYGLL